MNLFAIDGNELLEVLAFLWAFNWVRVLFIAVVVVAGFIVMVVLFIVTIGIVVVAVATGSSLAS